MMKKTAFFKRTLALALSLVLCFGLLPVLSLAAETVPDTLDAAKFNLGGSYSDKSYTSNDSHVSYSAKACENGAGMQIRTSKSAGIVTTANPDGLRVASIKVTFNSGHSSAGVIVYGKDSNYTAASDLYGNNMGTQIGTVSSSKLEITADELKDTNYKAIGFKPGDSKVHYIDSIEITWEKVGGTVDPGPGPVDPTEESTEPSTEPSTPVNPDPPTPATGTTYTQVPIDSTTTTIESGDYVMGFVVGDTLYAMHNDSSENHIIAEKIHFENGKITSDNTHLLMKVTMNGTDLNIQRADGTYLGWSSSTNFTHHDSAYPWHCTFTNNGLQLDNKSTRLIAVRTDNDDIGVYAESNLSQSIYHADISLFKAEEAPAAKLVTNVSAAVGDVIALDFYLNTTDYPDIASATITAKVGERNAEVKVANNIATVYLYAKEMDAEITLSATINGKEITYKYTFKDYRDPYLQTPNADQNLIDAVFAYGDQAKAYFAGETIGTPTNWNEEYWACSYDEKETDIAGTLKYRGSSLILEDTIALRHYFYIEDDSLTVDAILSKITVAGDTSFVVEDGGTGPEGRQVAIQINGITPGKIYDSYAVSYDATEIITTYSVANYCDKAILNDASVANLAKALLAIYWNLPTGI